MLLKKYKINILKERDTYLENFYELQLTSKFNLKTFELC